MTTITVNTQNQSYDVIIERNALYKASEYMSLDRKVLVVTDSGVPAIYAKTVAAQCKAPTIVIIPQGEESKNFDNYKLLLSKMLDNGFTRSDCVVAVGGGVIGDMAGFAAATYMRGIDFYNIPTTLLSQVDSSIGGKVAIDLNGIKNTVGAFYQPKCVFIDSDVLKTLESRQVMAGFAESIKMAATSNPDLFEKIEKSTDFETDIDMFIAESLKIKRDVVEEDPTEKGLRKVLNFGHTVGHAIESNEMGKLFHGECVALGMLPMCSQTIRNRICAVLEKYGLPTQTKLLPKELVEYIKHDKKAGADYVTAVYLNDIGNFEFKKISFGELEAYLENSL